MKLYRVCTENKNYPDILNYLDEHFSDGYTIINTNGTWQGVREKSLVIEIIGEDDPTEPALELFAYWLEKHNKQKAILIQVIHLIEDWEL